MYFIKGFFRKVFRLSFVSLFMAGIFIFVFVLIKETEILEKSLIKQNVLLAEIVAKSVENNPLNFESFKKIINSEQILFLWVIKPSGEIFLADNPAMQGKIIDDLFLGAKTVKVRNSDYLNKKIKLIVYPLNMKNEKGHCALYLGASLKVIEVAKREVIFSGLFIFFIVIFFSFFICFYFSKGVVSSLGELKKGAEIIRKGNFKHRIVIKTKDEIEDLGKTFNQMAEDLERSHSVTEEAKNILEIKVQARTKELKELAENLEDRIEEKTKELQARIKELENFYHLNVNRELRMMELKREIEKLKTELKK
jgi:methyl-accepting chemotaxis protein